MQSFEEYMKNLKQWLQDTADSQLEEMSDFFTKRLHDYEEHMAIWEKSYRIFAEVLPLECQKILDLGCGTGLELDKIWQINPNIEVIGVGLCENMLNKLLEKHSDKHLKKLLQNAGFVIEKVLDGSATIIIAGKGSDQTSSNTSSKMMVI